MKNAMEQGSGPNLRPMISIAELLERIPISRTTLDKMVKEGRFPKPYPITPTKFGFFVDEVASWQRELVGASGKSLESTSANIRVCPVLSRNEIDAQVEVVADRRSSKRVWRGAWKQQGPQRANS